MARSYSTEVAAVCDDCEWRDGGRGALGRAAQHHDKTGHEVKVTTTVTYQRAANPDQLAMSETA